MHNLNIRTKLAAVFGVIGVVCALIFVFVWSPRTMDIMVAAEREELSNEIEILGDSITPFLLSKQYAAVHETLISIEKRFDGWNEIRLSHPDGRRLYPVFPRTVEHNDTTITLMHDITFEGEPLGRLEAFVDIGVHLKKLSREIALLGAAGIILSVFSMALIWVTLDRLVARRLTLLAEAAHRIASGDYNSSLPPENADEVGRLTRSFANMRRRIATQTHDLKAARRAAEEALEVKSRFLATMSHEIRTPLNGIIPIAELLEQSDLTKEQRWQVEAIRTSGKALLTIVDDVLDLSKFQSDNFKLSPEPLRLSDIVRDVERIVGTPASTKGVLLRSDLPPELDRLFMGDKARIRQILLNLVGNAVKFTEEGSVTIRARIVDMTEADVSVEFQVIDTGIGIGKEYLERIFERFEQAEGGLSRRFGGSGLGLAIARTLVEAHDGAIWVESELGKGSTFHFTLQLSRVDSASEPAEDRVGQSRRRVVRPNPVHRPDGKKLHVLVVDDSDVNRDVARAHLKAIDVEVDTVVDGIEAIEAVRNQPYDLVLMDVHMPVMDGLEATRRIRTMPPPLCDLHIIALTASVMPEDVEMCFDAGMDDFLRKPIVQKDLIEKIFAEQAAAAG
jgi:signal transduction histidine kinase/ActR/RegA family two-component response regulator